MLKTSAIAIALVLGAGAAQAAVIDFEGFANGDAVNSVSAGGINATVTTNSRGKVDQAIVFDTRLTGTRDPDLEGPFEGPVTDPGNVLIISEGGPTPDDEMRGGTITFLFDQLVNFTGFAGFDDFDDGRDLLVTADTGQSASLSGSGDGSSSLITGLEFFGITELTFDFAGSGAIDDLVVEAVDGPAPIPVPAALPLLLAGLGGLGLVARRRRAA